MKRLLIVLVLLAVVVGCSEKAEASGDWDPCETKLSAIFNECAETHEKTLDHYEKYDYGLWFDLLYAFKNKNEVGLRTSWEVQRNEFTALVGGALKFGPGAK